MLSTHRGRRTNFHFRRLVNAHRPVLHAVFWAAHGAVDFL